MSSKNTWVVSRARLGALILFIVAGATQLNAQAVSQISGTVTDQSGSVVPGVQITATQTDTGTKRTTATDSSGAFVLPNLAVGPYQLEATKSGFRSYVQTGVVLQVSSSPVIPITLAVGQVTEKIEVEANAALVEVRGMGVGNVIENQRILDLPLNGRQVTDLITLAGAAVQTGASPQWGMKTGVQISVAGGVSYGVGYVLDGAPLSNVYDATGFPLPFPDALQEFKVDTSSLTAQNGGHSGASVSGVTKSGTNALHGDAFEFLRNNDTNARNFFLPTRDILKRNQFGGVIGGPIKKDRLFFFGGYQGTTIRQTIPQPTAFLPTAAMLNGNFTAYAKNCAGGDLRGPFTGNTIAPSKLSPAAVKVAKLLPAANNPADPCGRLDFSVANQETDGQIVGRIDYQLNDKHTIFGRYLGTWNHSPVPYTLPGATLLATNYNGLDDLATSVSLGDTWLINASAVNSFRAALNREATNHPGPQFFGPSDVGINAFASTGKAWWVIVAGGFNFGSGVGQSITLYNTTVSANDDITLVRGSHQFGFGGNVSHTLIDGTANVFSQGFNLFVPAITGGALSDFLTGNVFQFQQTNPNTLIEAQYFFGLYAQDTWKVKPRLTVNYGLRWEPFFPMVIKDSKVFRFSLPGYQQNTVSRIFPNAPPGFSYPGDPGFDSKASTSTQWNDFQPRIGFAWDPKGDGRTSIRGGASIAYDFVNMQLNHNMATASPFGGRIITNFVNFDNPYANFPGGNPFPYIYSASHALFTPFGAFQPTPLRLKTPSVQTWNLAIQRQISQSWFASVSYAGNHGIHLLNQIELNPTVLLPGATGSNENQRRVLYLQSPQKAQNIGNVTQFDDSATSDYHALLLNTTYRLRSGVNANVNYTWSRCIGDVTVGAGVPGPAGNTPNNYLGGNRRLDRGNCQSDRRHLFNLSMVAQTPRFNNKAMRLAASGWTASLIYQYRSGDAVNIVTGVDNLLSGAGGGTDQAPNLLLANPYGSGLQYLNPKAFGIPAPGVPGNMGLWSLAGPGYSDVDVSLVRGFRIREGIRLEVRGEAFNIANSMRPNIGLNMTSLQNFQRVSSSTFGTISTSYDPRIMQFALKIVF